MILSRSERNCLEYIKNEIKREDNYGMNIYKSFCEILKAENKYKDPNFKNFGSWMSGRDLYALTYDLVADAQTNRLDHLRERADLACAALSEMKAEFFKHGRNECCLVRLNFADHKAEFLKDQKLAEFLSGYKVRIAKFVTQNGYGHLIGNDLECDHKGKLFVTLSDDPVNHFPLQSYKVDPLNTPDPALSFSDKICELITAYLDDIKRSEVRFSENRLSHEQSGDPKIEWMPFEVRLHSYAEDFADGHKGYGKELANLLKKDLVTLLKGYGKEAFEAFSPAQHAHIKKLAPQEQFNAMVKKAASLACFDQIINNRTVILQNILIENLNSRVLDRDLGRMPKDQVMNFVKSIPEHCNEYDHPSQLLQSFDVKLNNLKHRLLPDLRNVEKPKEEKKILKFFRRS